MVDVVDRFELWVTLLDDFIKAHCAHTGKAGVQRGEALHVRIRAHMLIMVEANAAHLVFDRND